MSANERQVGGTHYRSQAQHWDYMAETGWGEGYFKGVITKYLARWRKKNGKEDLEKALHYTEKLIELVKFGRVELNPPKAVDTVFLAANFPTHSAEDSWDTIFIHRVFYATGVNDLVDVQQGLQMKLLRIEKET